MSIKIKRNTGWLGTASKIAIKVNGEKVAKISNNQEMEIEIPDETAQLKVSQTGMRSNEIEVQDGDVVEVTTSKSTFVIFFLVFASLLMMNVVQNTILPAILLIAFAVGFFLIEGFELKAVNKEAAVEE